MGLHGVRHLPVMEGTALVGLVSDRDIKEAGFFRRPDGMLAGEIMSTDLITAPPDALLTDMVYVMIVKKINAVPILKQGQGLAGIFTSYDLMQLVLNYAFAEEERSMAFEASNLIPFPEGQSIEWNRGTAVKSKRLS
jgi:CBS domain-containing protein